MELLIALIPALPLAGFLAAVLIGARVDHVPSHGHGDDDHDDVHGSDAHAAGARRARRPRHRRFDVPHRPE